MSSRYSAKAASVRSTPARRVARPAVDALAEAGDSHHPALERRAVGGHHEQAGRVRPAVDRGDGAGESPAELVDDPAADGVPAAREVPGEVGVETLHARPGSADTA